MAFPSGFFHFRAVGSLFRLVFSFSVWSNGSSVTFFPFPCGLIALPDGISGIRAE